MISHKIKPGLSTIIKKEVSNFDTAGSIGSGVLDYMLSTPAVVTMAIEASVGLLDPLLPDGYITVGKSIDMMHTHPTLVGEKISMVVTVLDITSENVLLDIVIHDAYGLVCKGSHERVIAKSDSLIEIAYARAAQKL